MKILFSSYRFAPSIGGIETVGRQLLAEFTRRGHEVHVITETPGPAAAEDAYALTRQPTRRQLCDLVRWCEVCFHNNLSLRTAWPLLYIRRPWVVAHHTWLTRVNGSIGWRDRLKRRIVGHARNIAVSAAVAEQLDVPIDVIPNPYRDDIFREIPGIPRDRELMFLGRLVSDKGADLLLEALSYLSRRGVEPHLTITGDGPDRAKLERQTTGLGLRPRVTFTGPLEGEALAECLNRHQILVVPSRWKEPFGLVAVEAIACGCVIVGSAHGGLQAAIGACGTTFPNGDTLALAALLERLLATPRRLRPFRERAVEHLEPHRPAAVADRYLKVLHEALGRR